MHEVLTPREMGRADALAIGSGIPGINLMEAAGRAVADAAEALAPEGPVLVLAGPGNNGGDGYVAARLLRDRGRSVNLILCGDPARIRGDAAIARARWDGPEASTGTPLPDATLAIDALFGAGLDREITGEPARLVAAVNALSAVRLAVDVPSGLDGGSGQIRGCAVAADATVTFFRKKPGHLLEPGRGLCGALSLADIGIPARVLGEIEPACFENLPALWTRVFPRPGRLGHKYDRGHALVVSGEMACTGASRLAAGAALRAGAGLVTLASPGNALAVNAAHLTAVMLRRADDAVGLAGILTDRRFSSVAIGPGLGADARARQMVISALAAPVAAVLDADAITTFAEDRDQLFTVIAGREMPAILTPHTGEFARLFSDLTAGSKLERARKAASLSGAIVVLKGADSVIATPDGRAAINTNAPPWLATAGSGDVLAGIVAGLLAQGMPGFEAACAAVWLHGEAGAEAGPGLIAEDLAPSLRPALARLLNAP